MMAAPRATAKTLWRDYHRGGRHDVPEFLREHLADDDLGLAPHRKKNARPKRQARHLA